MIMSLTPLEADFLGDLAQDDYDLWELFQFVRLHNPEDEDRGLARGRAPAHWGVGGLDVSGMRRALMAVPPDRRSGGGHAPAETARREGLRA